MTGLGTKIDIDGHSRLPAEAPNLQFHQPNVSELYVD
jgi:hypothetical protein